MYVCDDGRQWLFAAVVSMCHVRACRCEGIRSAGRRLHGVRQALSQRT
jgi:hypothetical protein